MTCSSLPNTIPIEMDFTIGPECSQDYNTAPGIKTTILAADMFPPEYNADASYGYLAMYLSIFTDDSGGDGRTYLRILRAGTTSTIKYFYARVDRHSTVAIKVAVPIDQDIDIVLYRYPANTTSTVTGSLKIITNAATSTYTPVPPTITEVDVQPDVPFHFMAELIKPYEYPSFQAFPGYSQVYHFVGPSYQEMHNPLLDMEIDGRALTGIDGLEYELWQWGLPEDGGARVAYSNGYGDVYYKRVGTRVYANVDYYLILTSINYLEAAPVQVSLKIFDQCMTHVDRLPYPPTESFSTSSACTHPSLYRYYVYKFEIAIPEYSGVTPVTFLVTENYYYMNFYIYERGTNNLVAYDFYNYDGYSWTANLPPGEYDFIVRPKYTYMSLHFRMSIDADIDYFGECELSFMDQINEWYDREEEPELNSWCFSKMVSWCEANGSDCPEDCQRELASYMQQYKPAKGHDGMTPSRHDIKVWRGTSFEMELITEIKAYNYDPAVNQTGADLRRTHAENLEFHGFTYEYVDFASLYDRAEMIIRKSWIKQGQAAGESILELTTDNGGLQLTDKSVKIGISSEGTQELEFDSGVLELKLIIEEVLSDEDIKAGVEPELVIDKLIYGTVTVLGTK